MGDWKTVTVVIVAEDRDAFMDLLQHVEAVRFAASEPGVTRRAVELGAEPGDWDDVEPGSVWLCDECFELVCDGLLAVCQDGCARHLDHIGPCHRREHDGDTCQRCGESDRLTEVELANLTEEQLAMLAVRA
jgi:hypothetical protein